MMRAWTNLHHIPFIVEKQYTSFALGTVGGLLKVNDAIVGHYMILFIDNNLDIWFIESQNAELNVYSLEEMMGSDEVVVNKIYM